jgi:hypothetical protein
MMGADQLFGEVSADEVAEYARRIVHDLFTPSGSTVRPTS